MLTAGPMFVRVLPLFSRMIFREQAGLYLLFFLGRFAKLGVLFSQI